MSLAIPYSPIYIWSGMLLVPMHLPYVYGPVSTNHYYPGRCGYNRQLHFLDTPFSFALSVVSDVSPPYPKYPETLRWRHMSVIASQIASNLTLSSIMMTMNTSKFNITYPLWGEFTGDRWFAARRDISSDNVLVSWRHHEWQLSGIHIQILEIWSDDQVKTLCCYITHR